MASTTMILFILLCFMLMLMKPVYLQQCRQVTVCDEDALGSAARGRGGEKGDVGAPGKAGAPGTKGEKGEVDGIGPKGDQGESCSLGGFEEEMRQRLEAIESFIHPASCASSQTDGRQRLNSGEEVLCERGWTVFQKRFDGSVSFDRNWQECKNGFGNLNGEFWLGLDKIHNLTRNGGCRLRIELTAFDGDQAYAEYSSFSVDDESENYRIYFSGYSGTAGDSLSLYDLNGRPFTTKDRDNDGRSSGNCAVSYGGPWWYDNCSYVTLNSLRVEGGTGSRHMAWNNFKQWNSLKESLMKFRCD